MLSTSRHCSKLTTLTLALGLVLSQPLAAQAQSNIVTFNIAQQPLSQALNQLAEQADMSLIADANLLDNLQAPALYGQKTVRDALTQTLQGTAIIAEIVGNTIILKGTNTTATTTAPADLQANLAEQPKHADDIEVIVVKGDQINLNREQLERTKGSSNADIFSTHTSIEANNLRNEAGALDIGIRGVQGEGRVPVFIDGSLQSTHTNRGYMGTSDRTYIDSDLISTVSVEKGASSRVSPYGAGAIGGTVTISTLNPSDILSANQEFGVLMKLKTYNNNKTPEISDDPWQQEYYQVTQDQDSSQFENGGLVLASAYKGDDFSGVLAYSKKETGNYFAGSHGYDQFVDVTDSGFERLPPVNQGAEVVNTSFASESYLAKFNYAFNDEHSVEVNTRHHQQEAGEMLASYWLKYTEGDYWRLPDGTFGIIPQGIEAMPQWEPGTAHVNSASATYHYLPTNNNKVDLKVNLWSTNAKLKQYNALGSNLGPNALQYLHEYSNRRHGVSVYNTATFKLADSIPTVLTTGFSWQDEKLTPKEGSEDNFWSGTTTSRNGKQTSQSLFANAQLDFDALELVLNANIHNAETEDYQTGLSQEFDEKTDFTAQLYYQLLSNTTLKAKYSHAYRMPSVYETTVSNEVFSYSPYYPVAPEQTNSFEVGVESQFSGALVTTDSLTIAANYFDTQIKDMIATANLPNLDPAAPEWLETSSTFTNYDSFTLPGIEVLLNYTSQYVYASASITKYQNIEICSAQMAELAGVATCNNLGFSGSLTPLRIPPEKNYVATLGFTLFDDALDAGFIYKKHSDKSHPGGFLSGTGAANVLAYIPASYQLDMYLDYTFSPRFSAYTSITNVTDRYAVSAGSIVAVPEPGRTVTIGLEIKL
ncbi:TonB-dependent receptor [Pseudoalteromonas haloplanktis]|uniref:TonB-dependent receptor n=1 Tax=Pseudoalteromonas haloplanktis TaxID=228 RepID=A0ABU1BCC0_PSEHA|nr:MULTISPECIES: TonB-dependent receptor [Pseudoalteromonas]MDQ9092113.1 TonB-dependent receptor [Pseudoalteromonas haloplanktis]TMN71141.1 hypothetical protein CWB85_12560 [Pseudoalteromonas sp. S1727]